MKITLYMATTIDGLIAKNDGDSDWVSPIDSVNFEKAIQENGCIIVGRRTFEQYHGDLYPVKDITNIVFTSKKGSESNEENVYFCNSVEEALQLAKSKSKEKVLLIGGGKTNAAFLKAGVIDEVILSLHPLALGNGIRLFDNGENVVKLHLLSVNQLEEGLVQLKYKVIK